MRERGSKGGEGDRQTDSKNAGGKRVREREGNSEREPSNTIL